MIEFDFEFVELAKDRKLSENDINKYLEQVYLKSKVEFSRLVHFIETYPDTFETKTDLYQKVLYFPFCYEYKKAHTKLSLPELFEEKISIYKEIALEQGKTFAELEDLSSTNTHPELRLRIIEELISEFDSLSLPKELDTPKARKYFEKAKILGFITFKEDLKLQWNRNKKQLVFFLVLVYCKPYHRNKDNIVKTDQIGMCKLQNRLIEELFSCKDIASTKKNLELEFEQLIPDMRDIYRLFDEEDIFTK